MMYSIWTSRKTSNKDEITLDLQPHCAKEALKLSKLLLCSLADIPSKFVDFWEFHICFLCIFHLVREKMSWCLLYLLQLLDTWSLSLVLTVKIANKGKKGVWYDLLFSQKKRFSFLRFNFVLHTLSLIMISSRFKNIIF